ncbi:MAG TPA: homoserine dehydrogenase [Anaerolineae bacterium]|nr:homoserine dehydrogenase [Anaerolineae bacterium]
MKHTVKLGLIGFGTVGTGVAKILYGSQKPHLRGRSFDIELVKISDLDITTNRGVDVPVGVLTTDVNEILNDPEISIVIELIGGYEPARTFTLEAFAQGKSVVTANKALIAKHGSELFRAAAKANVSYMFEASVGGGIPILRNIVDGLNANVIQSVYGILNGTTNYILTGMARDGLGYGEVLARAQELGYAEADPTSDVSGEDALNKIIILARLAFGATLEPDKVYCEGIENVTIQDIEYARELGYTIKLLAIAKRHDDGRIEVRVHPTLMPSDSVMASVEDEFNAVEIFGDAVGREIFYGKGAGMMPTASAVVSDVMDIASRTIEGSPTNVSRIVAGDDEPELVHIGDVKLRYYLRFTARDRPGVLAAISKVFADENISIESVIQKGTAEGDYVPIVITTHEAREGAMQQAMKQFKKLDTVRGNVQLIRIEYV